MRILVLYPGLYEDRRKLLAPHKWRLKLTRTSLILADDCVHPDDTRVFGDALLLPPAERVEEVWRVLAGYLDRHPVEGIVAQSESGLLIGARVAREYGLPGPTVESVMATVNKFQTRTRLKAAGIAQPAYELVRSAAEVKRFAGEHGWPIVLKAIASSRQRLVSRVDCAEDVDAAVEDMLSALPAARDVVRMQSFAKLDGIDLGLDPCRQFLVEEFQTGIPLECDAMISGATPRWFGVCEQVPCRERGFFIAGYLLPGRLDAGQQSRVLQVAEDSVRALGLEDTGTSVELRLGRDGPRIIEVNGRLPWDEGMQELVEASVGAMPAVLALKIAMGRKLSPLRLRRHASLLYRSNYIAGLVESLPDAEEWKRITGRAEAAWLFTHEGESLLHGDHPDSRPHVAGVLTAHRKSIRTAFDEGNAMLDRLRIQIQPVQTSKNSPVEASHRNSILR
ncbi:MAG: biotin carboxylase [Candidatus Paceibacteria bacterium]|jgi:biotin carboxylase